MDDQISMLKWHQKENVMVQIRTPVSLVTKSRLDHVWGHPTISIFMEWNKVCSISFMEIARGHSKMHTSASGPAAIETLRFKTATRDDDTETNYFKRVTGQKSCHILSIV